MGFRKISILKNIEKDIKKGEQKKKVKVDVKWIFTIAILSFFISLFMSFVSEIMLSNVTLFFSILITLIFIILGILFDIIGVSVTSSDEKVFHSMNAKKIRGASISVFFKKNAEKVSSFCCDVIGDICGVISGSSGVVIAATLSTSLAISPLVITLITTAVIASLTITGKAIGKSLAINNSNAILYNFAKIISYVYRK